MTPGNETAAPNNGHAPDQRIADLRHDAAALRSLGAELALASMTVDASQFRLHELASAVHRWLVGSSRLLDSLAGTVELKADQVEEIARRSNVSGNWPRD